jgi:indole-3-glycerol phosphate synthase
MMTILDEILLDVRAEVAAAKHASPISEIRARLADAPPPQDFGATLCQGGFGLIAEIKRRSPSVGPMREENVNAAASTYADSSHVRAVSILTNHTHFGMGIEDLAKIRAMLPKPILRKDFFIDEYQILEARAYGADAILLMANVLESGQLQDFHQLARELGMEAIFEVHTLEEIAMLPVAARIVGINSRKFKATSGFVGATGSSLKDFSLEMSAFDLVDHLPASRLRVAESGLDPKTISSVSLKFDAALVGTSLLRDPRGIAACLADFEQAIEAPQSSYEN